MPIMPKMSFILPFHFGLSTTIFFQWYILLFSLMLTLQYIMPQNGQIHFKNLAANGAGFLKYVSPFSDMPLRVKKQHWYLTKHFDQFLICCGKCNRFSVF